MLNLPRSTRTNAPIRHGDVVLMLQAQQSAQKSLFARIEARDVPMGIVQATDIHAIRHILPADEGSVMYISGAYQYSHVRASISERGSDAPILNHHRRWVRCSHAARKAACS